MLSHVPPLYADEELVVRQIGFEVCDLDVTGIDEISQLFEFLVVFLGNGAKKSASPVPVTVRSNSYRLCYAH